MIKINPLPPQERLLELFSYDAETGDLARKISTMGSSVGDIAGHRDGAGYRRVQVDGRSYVAHRLIWKMVYSVDPKDQLDHINQKRSDNRISNLREVTPAENQKNKTQYCNNTSGHTGVVWNKPAKKWCAMIKVSGCQKNLGCFIDKSEAAAARKEAEIKYEYHPNHGSTQQSIR